MVYWHEMAVPKRRCAGTAVCSYTYSRKSSCSLQRWVLIFEVNSIKAMGFGLKKNRHSFQQHKQRLSDKQKPQGITFLCWRGFRVNSSVCNKFFKFVAYLFQGSVDSHSRVQALRVQYPLVGYTPIRLFYDNLSLEGSLFQTERGVPFVRWSQQTVELFVDFKPDQFLTVTKSTPIAVVMQPLWL